VVAIAERLHGGLDNVIGCPEIGLADAEVDDVTALSGELGCPRENREGVLLADPVEAGNRMEQDILPEVLRQFAFKVNLGA
jgi:hypothetical protein